MSSKVSITKCNNYEEEAVNKSVQNAFDLLGGISRFIKPNDNVLLKVNLLTGAPPEKAVTTHPAIVKAVIKEVRKANAIPHVGDCSGYEGPVNRSRYYNACRTSGIEQVCKEEEVKLIHLSAESTVVENPKGKAFKNFTLAKDVVDSDVIINLPKLKTHGLCIFTGAVKNIFGCVPGLHKAQMHLRAQGIEYFSQMLVDLLLVVNPSLTLMDAIVGMEGDGPGNGDPKQIGAVLASADAVAIDAVACKMVGIEPSMIPTTRLAHEQKVGIGTLGQIEILGESLEKMKIDDFKLPVVNASFFKSKGLMSFLQGRLVAKPYLIKNRCKSCWTCLEHCPSKAISRKEHLPSFDYSKCIHCYCCQELCPEDAIKLKRPLLARILK